MRNKQEWFQLSWTKGSTSSRRQKLSVVPRPCQLPATLACELAPKCLFWYVGVAEPRTCVRLTKVLIISADIQTNWSSLFLSHFLTHPPQHTWVPHPSRKPNTGTGQSHPQSPSFKGTTSQDRLLQQCSKEAAPTGPDSGGSAQCYPLTLHVCENLPYN